MSNINLRPERIRKTCETIHLILIFVFGRCNHVIASIMANSRFIYLCVAPVQFLSHPQSQPKASEDVTQFKFKGCAINYSILFQAQNNCAKTSIGNDIFYTLVESTVINNLPHRDTTIIKFLRGKFIYGQYLIGPFFEFAFGIISLYYLYER